MRNAKKTNSKSFIKIKGDFVVETNTPLVSIYAHNIYSTGDLEVDGEIIAKNITTKESYNKSGNLDVTESVKVECNIITAGNVNILKDCCCKKIESEGSISISRDCKCDLIKANGSVYIKGKCSCKIESIITPPGAEVFIDNKFIRR